MEGWTFDTWSAIIGLVVGLLIGATAFRRAGK